LIKKMHAAALKPKATKKEAECARSPSSTDFAACSRQNSPVPITLA
jgi:hypothetical protein